MISNSPDQVTYIRAESGYPLAVKLAFTKADDSPMDLTTCMLLFYMTQPKHKGGAAIDTGAEITLDTPNTLGRALLYMQGEGIDLPPGEYPFAITVTPMQGLATIVVKGIMEIVDNPNLAGVPDFTYVNPASEISVKLTKRNNIVIKTNHLPDKTLAAYTELAATNASAAGISAQQAAGSAAAAANSATNAANSVAMVGNSVAQAAASAATAHQRANAAADSAEQSEVYKEEAATFAAQAAASNVSASSHSHDAFDSAGNAQASADTASIKAGQAATSATVAQAALEDIENFTKGDTGATGAQGPQGPQGVTGVFKVHHLTNGAVARPAYPLVYWIGSAVPANATDYDWWLPEDVAP